MTKKLITAESVGMGHPDKICDQIADAILDACLTQDSFSRVACEVCAFNHLIVIGGEITTNAVVNYVKTAWGILLKIGYSKHDFTIITNINEQSSDISKMVDNKGKRCLDINLGAGDQGITVGYATNETKNYMPLEIDLANELVRYSTQLIKTHKFKSAKYDIKSQVTID
jgi:S-adenosylmethionine synthetase